MSNYTKRLAGVIVLLLFSQLSFADNYAAAKESFERAGESARYFDDAYGYALFPTIGKGGFGVGGAYGEGQVYAQDALIGRTTMGQVTVGLQVGGQAYSQIIFFENASALEQFISGNFEFSAQATAVALTAGATAEVNTGGGSTAGVSGGRNDAKTVHGGYRKGMAIFTIAKGGLMAEMSLGGQKFTYEPITQDQQDQEEI